MGGASRMAPVAAADLPGLDPELPRLEGRADTAMSDDGPNTKRN